MDVVNIDTRGQHRGPRRYLWVGGHEILVRHSLNFLPEIETYLNPLYTIILIYKVYRYYKSLLHDNVVVK